MTRVLCRLAADDPITPRHMSVTPRHMSVEAPSQRPPSLESETGKTQRIARALLLSSLTAALNTSPPPTPARLKEDRQPDDAGGAGAARGEGGGVGGGGGGGGGGGSSAGYNVGESGIQEWFAEETIKLRLDVSLREGAGNAGNGGIGCVGGAARGLGGEATEHGVQVSDSTRPMQPRLGSAARTEVRTSEAWVGNHTRMITSPEAFIHNTLLLRAEVHSFRICIKNRYHYASVCLWITFGRDVILYSDSIFLLVCYTVIK